MGIDLIPPERAAAQAVELGVVGAPGGGAPTKFLHPDGGKLREIYHMISSSPHF